MPIAILPALLLAGAAPRAKAAPMPDADAYEIMEALTTEAIQSCLDTETGGTTSDQVLLDTCDRAVGDIEERIASRSDWNRDDRAVFDFLKGSMSLIRFSLMYRIDQSVSARVCGEIEAGWADFARIDQTMITGEFLQSTREGQGKLHDRVAFCRKLFAPAKDAPPLD